MKKKISSLENISKIVSVLKMEGKKISLCHGVFDLLHPGHIYHFEQARKKADILIVSITSDKKVLKGPGRPYFNQKIRAHSLASIELIDFVIISDEESAVNVIKKIKPHFYVKGVIIKLK